MPNVGRFLARQLGCATTKMRRSNRIGQLIALFQSSFYVEFDDEVCCIGHAEFNSGPLNIITDVPASVDWRQCGLRLGDKVRTAKDKISVGQLLEFSSKNAKVWYPPITGSDWNFASLQEGLNNLNTYYKNAIPSEGLGRFVLSDRSTIAAHPVSYFAEPAVDEFRYWLQGRIDTPKWLNSFIGLGPGLTPSGDDFIGGAMITLRNLGDANSVDQIWNICCPISLALGNRISHAHLACAASGYGSASLHETIIALMHGRNIKMRRAIEDLDRTGHTSGWDALAGAVTACRAYLGDPNLRNRLQTVPSLIESLPR